MSYESQEIQTIDYQFFIPLMTHNSSPITYNSSLIIYNSNFFKNEKSFTLSLVFFNAIYRCL
jgi:hypothetical protein